MLPLQKRKVFASGKSDKKTANQAVRQGSGKSLWMCGLWLRRYEYQAMRLVMMDDRLGLSWSSQRLLSTVPYFDVLSEEREGAYAPLTDIRGWMRVTIRQCAWGFHERFHMCFIIKKNVLCSWSFYISCGVLPRLSWLAGAKKLLIVTAD